ncbi:hypothetical protein FisN_3Lh008 [Fistulifera solaris]|uniref:Uncharacterized protein n=1 Tax=Fistulifera solaris TaxID=1519565 RepID=A0A1Z5JYG2_FISSO|nr:hypothetical protein FisN_3Lh008 [Fistulifera solaris]|eukprot:GAX19073.1 hypothetical protein FisN_3Lh008 [Fistulifera solaris]
MSVFPSQTLAVFHDDEEWLSRLIADTQALEEFPSSAFIDRFLKDRYCDTLSCWTEWIAQAEAYGFIIPREISFIQSYDVPSSASTKTRLPARLSESFVRAITILLNVSRYTAIELTTTALAMSSVDITTDEFEAGLDLILKVVECYHRQRIARLGLLTELLRIEQAASSEDVEHSQAHSTLSRSKAKGIVQQLEPFNLFAILLMAAYSQEDREVPSTSLSRPQREALQTNEQDAFGYLYEVLRQLVRPARSSPGENSELDASSLMFAGIGREAVSAAISAFSQNLENVNNVDILCLLAAITTQNSPIMTQQFWVDWSVYTKMSEERPLCVLMDRAHQLAQRNCPLPFLRMVTSIVSTSESVRVVLEDFVPPNLFSQALLSKEKNEDLLVVVLECVRVLAHHASSASARLLLCRGIDPKLLCQAVLESASENAGAAGMQALSVLLQDNAEWTRVIADSFHWIVGESWKHLVFRGNLTAGAAAQFLSRLFRNMTAVFFAPDTKETFVFSFLSCFYQALMPLVSLLSSSVPMLSKPALVGQKQLTYKSAISIMECVHTTLQYAGPMEALHPSVAVAQAVSDFRWNIISSIPGKSIIFYATLPVSLSIARFLDEEIRDAHLIRLKRDPNSFQIWIATASMNPLSNGEFQSLIMESLENSDLLSFDFSDMAFQEGDTLKMPIQAASTAITLLSMWCSVVDSRRQRNSEAVDTEYPHVLLSERGDLPHLSPTTSRAVTTVWNAASISYAELFTRYVQIQALSDDDASISEKGMNLLVVLSERAALLKDDSFFRTVLDSRSLSAKLGKQIELLSRFEGDCDDKIFTFSFAILAHCARFNLEGVTKVLPSSSMKTMQKFIQDTCSNLLKLKQQGAGSSATQNQLDIATGCLQLVLSLRRAGSCIGMNNPHEFYACVVRDLLGFLSVCVPSEDDSPCAGLLTNFRRLALDLIALELSILPAHHMGEQRIKLFSEFNAVFGRDLSGLVTLSRYYLELRHLDQLFQVYNCYFGEFDIVPGKSVEQIMGYFANKTGKLCQESFDISFASSWLAAFRSEKSITLNDLALTYSRFLGENYLLVSWKSLLTFVAIQEDVIGRGPQQSHVLGVHMKLETLTTMLRNLEAMERIQPDLLRDTKHRVVTTLSFLSFHCSQGGEDWADIIRLVTNCCRKIVQGTSYVSATDAFAGVEQLLAYAATLLNEVHPVFANSSETDILISLADIACQIVEMISRYHMSSGDHGSHLHCLTVCISVLAALIIQEEPPNMLWRGESEFSERIFQLLKEYDVIQNLAARISFAVTNDGSSTDQDVTSPCDSTHLVLALLSKIASIGDADMLSLLVGSELARLLPKPVHFSIHSVGCFSMRGYIAKAKSSQKGSRDETQLSRNPRSLEQGRDDPLHKVWRASITFLAAGLRSATAQDCDEVTRERYVILALDFLTANAETIRTCLKQCSSILFDQEYPVLTMTLLEEAGLILSLAGELCSNDTLKTFQRKYRSLYNMFLNFCKTLLVSLSSFICSSSTSRELFRCIDEVEDADTMALDSISHISDLGILFFTLAGGISNARHEAIRHSHFASRCSAPVTPDDVSKQASFPPGFESDARLRTNSDPNSLYSLERNCREAVNNTFSLQMELQAARVLCHVVHILLRAHPAATSLVMLLGDAHHDAMQIIREGSHVALQVDPRSPTITLAEIVRCDTVNRRWEVCSWQKGSSIYSVVSRKQIVGVEDVSLRQAILDSAPAPRSSAELAKSVGAASLGHLILALRWCRYSDIVEDGYPVAKRLAELCTFLLTTEISMHRESGTFLSTETLCLQLMDLYGEEEEFATLLKDFLGPLSEDRRGQLQSILDREVWSMAREQLYDEIHEATLRMQQHVHGRGHSSVAPISPRKYEFQQ